MAKKDAGAKETDEVLKTLEEQIAKEYAQAEKELAEKLGKYISSFTTKNQSKLNDVAAGKMTQSEYEQWLYGQLAVGDRWKEMRDTIAQDLTNTDKIAKSVAYGHMPEVYAINHNYGTYQVEKAAHINTSYTLYNKQTVENLFKDDFKFYKGPGKLVSEKINENADLAWNKKQVQSVMAQAILQGEGMRDITKRLRSNTQDTFTAADIKNAANMTAKQVAKAVEQKNRNAAIRNARTMTTCVQNAGRLDSYKRAESMGIEIQNEWIAALDDRTRHEHRLLDGQKVNVGEKFVVEGEEIEFPGDPRAPGYLVYNCRCSLAPFIKGISKESDYYNDLSDRETSKLGNMTYEEWKNAHGTPTNTPTQTTTTKNNGNNSGTSGITRTDTYNYLKNHAEACNIKHNKVEELKNPLKKEEIVEKLAGGDKTKGSCASLALAYCANTAGLDVTDFRGGASQEMFSQRFNTVQTLKVAEANVQKYTATKEARDVAKTIKEIPLDKEYVLEAGKHASIIRRTDSGLQYLELQNESSNGWKNFERKNRNGDTIVTVEDTLKDRFGCRKTAEKSFITGETVERSFYLTEVDTFKNNDEVKEILGYVNTDVSKQKKGRSGYAK